MTKIAVFGAGSWGTAFSLVLADAGNTVTLWARRQELSDAINRDHENTRVEVLKAESKKKVAINKNGTVKTGKWTSAYDGKTFTVGSKLDIDHLVPLQEAWTSGVEVP